MAKKSASGKGMFGPSSFKGSEMGAVARVAGGAVDSKGGVGNGKKKSK